jgi:hypothetical protein
MAHLWKNYLDNPDATYIGYYLKYDFTMWIKSLPEERAHRLLNPELRKRMGANPTPWPVDYGRWQFDMLGMRRFKLREIGYPSWMYICDVGPYFQMSFLRASERSKWKNGNGEPIHIMTDREYDILERGKSRRASAKLDAEMIEYNITENRVLSRMMDVLAHGMQDIGLRFKKQEWIGPGSTAQKWLTKNSTHTRKAVEEATPRDVLDTAISTYYGGWFETFAHGHIPGRTYGYDICSAYPSAHARCPCILHGKWKRGTGKLPKTSWIMIRADVSGPHSRNMFRMGPLPFRTKTGLVIRPLMADYGWVWLHEIEAAKHAHIVSDFKIQEWLAYTPCDCPPPTEGLRELYKMRLDIGKNTPPGMAYKLVYNSSYGKTAQSIGNPKFGNPVHASLITSLTRTELLHAIATHSDGINAVVMVATDGIYFTSPHSRLNMGTQLGQWEPKTHSNLTLLMPGVYWDDSVRTRVGALMLKSRGVSQADIIKVIDTFDNAFDDMRRIKSKDKLSDPDTWPKVSVQVQFSLVSPRQALARGKWNECGHVAPTERVISSLPFSKRRHPTPRTCDKNYISSHAPILIGAQTTAYKKSFGLGGTEMTDSEVWNMFDSDMFDTLNGLRD